MPAHIEQLYAAAGQRTPVVSLSCHSLEEIAQGRSAGRNPQDQPSLILYGPIVEKRVGEKLISEGLGFDLLRQACALAAPTPVLALGGITAACAKACLAAGATGVAGIRLFQ